MSQNDNDRDDFEKVLGSPAEPAKTGNEPGQFTRMFSVPAPGQPPQRGANAGPENAFPGLPSTTQPDEPAGIPSSGVPSSNPSDFTRVFGSGTAAPSATNLARNPREESPSQPPFSLESSPLGPSLVSRPPTAPGSFTAVFGSSTNQPARQTPPSIPPAVSEPGPRQPSFGGSFGERDSQPPADDFAKYFQEPPRKPAPPAAPFNSPPFRPSPVPVEKPFSAEQVPGSMPSFMGEGHDGANSRAGSTKMFSSSDSLQLNPIDVPGGPSAYTRVVKPSDIRAIPSSAASGNPAAPPNPAPGAPVPPMVQPPAWQMPTPQVQMQPPNLGVPQVPQVSWTPPQMTLPPAAPPPQAQPPAPGPGASKWAPYMPLIIGMNIFLLVALFLIVIVFLSSKH